MNFVENDHLVKKFSSELHRKHRSLTNHDHMVDLHLNQLHICHYYNQKKVEFVITFKTLFEFIFLIDQYWERVIFISKGYPGLKIFVNIHERSYKLHKNEWTYPKKFLSYQTAFITAKYFTFAIRTVSYSFLIRFSRSIQVKAYL